MGYYKNISSGFGARGKTRLIDSASTHTFRNKAHMSTNLEDFQALNKDVENWAEEQADMMKDNAPKDSGKLIRSLKVRVYEENGIVSRIGFRLKRYGVFREKGVGRGRGIGSGKEKPMPWFNPVLQRNLPELVDIAQMHFAEIALKNVYIN